MANGLGFSSVSVYRAQLFGDLIWITETSLEVGDIISILQVKNIEVEVEKIIYPRSHKCMIIRAETQIPGFVLYSCSISTICCLQKKYSLEWGGEDARKRWWSCAKPGATCEGGAAGLRNVHPAPGIPAWDTWPQCIIHVLLMGSEVLSLGKYPPGR